MCGNEWDAMLCDKKKYKCSDCPNRKLMPLAEKDIYNHLAGKDAYGRDVVGIYPMLKDETCNFLCVDFDEENFKQDCRFTIDVLQKEIKKKRRMENHVIQLSC